LIKLSGEDPVESQQTIEDLQVTLHDQEQEITNLEAASDIRLYTGLIQGAIIGLVTGGVAAWVVSRRIQVVEVDEDE
jgi:tetrahydromethanopterin S-methyltransferase subunit F